MEPRAGAVLGRQQYWAWPSIDHLYAHQPAAPDQALQAVHFLEKWPRQYADERLIPKSPAALHVRLGERNKAIIAAPFRRQLSADSLDAQANRALTRKVLGIILRPQPGRQSYGRPIE